MFGAVGVYGQGGAGTSSGVVGVGTGASGGVTGIGDPNSSTANGTGMRGFGGHLTGVGVWGTGATPLGTATATPPAGDAIGVFGAGGKAGSGNADGVYGVGAGSSRSGVVGVGDPNPVNGTGVRGNGGLPGGVGVWGAGGRLLLGPAPPAPPPGNAIGVFGAGGDGHSDGVYGIGAGEGYGGQFASGFAPLRLVPASAGAGHPTDDQHKVGEFYVDSQGSLFYCKVSGTPGSWVQLA